MSGLEILRKRNRQMTSIVSVKCRLGFGMFGGDKSPIIDRLFGDVVGFGIYIHDW